MKIKKSACPSTARRSVIKNTIACAAIFLGSATVCADTLSITEKNEPQPNEGVSKPNATTCPSEFHSVALPLDAAQCQQFESDIPAAMVYYTPLTPSQVISFYNERLPLFKTHPAISQRTLITSTGRNTKIVVSPDSTGAQVDILVTK